MKNQAPPARFVSPECQSREFGICGNRPFMELRRQIQDFNTGLKSTEKLKIATTCCRKSRNDNR